MDYVPFRFQQMCSCQLGNAVAGCHFAYYVGASYNVMVGACGAVPTLGGSEVSTMQSLGGALVALCASLLTEAGLRDHCDGFEPLQVSATTLCRPELPTGESGPQQTPDSAQHLIADRVQECAAPVAFPTEAKVREKAKRKQEKLEGREKVVQRRKKILEEHHDDCGEDLSSLAGFADPSDYNTDEKL